MGRRKRIALCVSVLFFGAVGFSLPLVDLNAGAMASGKPPRVLMVLIDKTTWSELDSIEPPNITRLARRGAIGAMSNRTAESRIDSGAAYLTIGTGLRALGGQAKRPLTTATVRELKRLNAAGDYRARVGLLAERLRRSGLSTAVLGNADMPGRDGRYVFGREIELIGVDGRGHVAGDTSTELLNSEGGTDYAALRAAFIHWSHKSDLVVVETGDTRRAEMAGAGLPDARRRALKRRAIIAADTFIGDIASGLDLGRDLLIIVSPSPPSRGLANPVNAPTPVIVVGGNHKAGLLASSSTRRSGLVTSVDLAPTIADHLGVSWGIDAPGRVMRTDPGMATFTQVAARSRGHMMAARLSVPIVWSYSVIVVLSIAAGVALLSLPQTLGPRIDSGVRLGLLAVFSTPLSIFVAPLLPLSMAYEAVYIAYVVAGVVLLTLVAWWLRHDRPLPILVISSMTWLFIVGNLLAGSPRDIDSALGYTATTAARFYGIGNQYLAILLAAALLSSLLWLERVGRQKRAISALAAFYVLLVVVVGQGSLGANTGGIMMMAPTFALAYFRAKGARLRAPHLIAAAALGVLALISLAATDAWLPAEPAHLGAATLQVYDGNVDAFAAVLLRKIDINLSVLSYVYSSYIPLILASVAGAIYFFLRRVRGLTVLGYPAIGTPVVVGLIGGAIGAIVNDSGAAILALVTAYILSAAVYLELAGRQT